MAIRMGLVGAGRMGATFAYHLTNSIAEAQLVAIGDAAIADAHGKTANEVAARFLRKASGVQPERM